MADPSGRGNESEFSEALPSGDYASANTEGKGHGAFAWEEASRWPSFTFTRLAQLTRGK